jgi:hypothetical protein
VRHNRKLSKREVIGISSLAARAILLPLLQWRGTRTAEGQVSETAERKTQNDAFAIDGRQANS